MPKHLSHAAHPSELHGETSTTKYFVYFQYVSKLHAQHVGTNAG